MEEGFPMSISSWQRKYSPLYSGTTGPTDATVFIGYPISQSKSEPHDQSSDSPDDHSTPSSDENKTRACWVWSSSILMAVVVIFWLAYFIVFSYFSSIFAPAIPSFSVSSIFATVHNVSAADNLVTEDLDLGFLVENKERNLMVYSGIQVSVYHIRGENETHKDETPIANAISDLRFEQSGKEITTVWLRLENVTMPVDEWDHSYHHTGFSKIYVRMNATAEYKGPTLGGHESPLEVFCDQVKIAFSDGKNATHNKPAVFQLNGCSTDGWPGIMFLALLFGFLGLPLSFCFACGISPFLAQSDLRI